MTKKPDLLLRLSEQPGPCSGCRHVNQGTADFAEGHLFCGAGGGAKAPESVCTVRKPGARSLGGPVELFYLYEPYDGSNGTYDLVYDARLLAPGADPAMLDRIGAGEPVR